MITNFFLLAFRNFLKHKLFVLINILGLGTAIGCCIVAYLNNKFEADFNSQYTNRDIIYKVNSFRKINDREQRYGISPISLAPLLSNELKEGEFVVRFVATGANIKYGNEADSKIFNQNLGFADKEFFRMFTHKLKSGTLDQFSDKGKIILTEKMAQKYFGKEDPIGKSLTTFDSKGLPVELSVAAVLDNIPLNSMVLFDAITIIDNYMPLYNLQEFDWKNWVGGTFFLIPNASDVGQVEKLLSKYIPIQNKAREDFVITRFQVQSLNQFTKESRDIWGNGLNADLHPAQRKAPAIMAILILLLACFNFMNTSISVANTRIKEIGVRKSVGARRAHLIIQFIGENTIICFMALAVSLLIGSYLVEEYNKMWEYMILKMSFSGNVEFWLFLLFMLVFTSIAAGAYPAFYISSFKPVAVLRGTFRFKGAGMFSKVLLSLQMIISVITLISSIVFTQNAKFQEKFDMGYEKESILVLPLANSVTPETFKAAFKSNPDIIDVASTSNHIGWGSYPRTIEYIDKKIEVRVMDINVDYIKTMGLKLIDGRGFEPESKGSDPFKSVVVNQQFIDELKLTDPLNKRIKLDTLDLNIVGVVKNVYNSLWEKINPAIFITRGQDSQSILVVRTTPEKKMEVLKFMKKEWEKLVPNSPFTGRQQTEILQGASIVNKNIKNINLFLAFVAIILSLIALYTLVSLNIIKRTKEIGIRTVLGSTGINIIYLISKPFLIILAISSVFGAVGGYFLNSMFLKTLWAYHSSINTLSIAIPVALLFAISFALLAIRVYLTLRKNPVESLRYE
ncbi:MAG: ABC transporter permease [Bacteroidales bacterium]|nr:MAG: ABC transporter permease [Bacteroidales bacterium]